MKHVPVGIQEYDAGLFRVFAEFEVSPDGSPLAVVFLRIELFKKA